MIKLEDFSEHLASITPKQWEKLFIVIPEIEGTEVFGQMVESKLQPDGSYTFPYWTKAEIVSRTGDLIHDELNLLPAFDWTKWKEGSALLHSGSDFKTLDIIIRCKLLTAIYRMDRFSEGHVVNIFEQGIMLRLLKALQHHVQNNNFP